MYKDSQERARYLYLSLTDQKDVMGVPLDAFKIILGINTFDLFFNKEFLVSFNIWCNDGYLFFCFTGR